MERQRWSLLTDPADAQLTADQRASIILETIFGHTLEELQANPELASKLAAAMSDQTIRQADCQIKQTESDLTKLPSITSPRLFSGSRLHYPVIHDARSVSNWNNLQSAVASIHNPTTPWDETGLAPHLRLLIDAGTKLRSILGPYHFDGIALPTTIRELYPQEHPGSIVASADQQLQYYAWFPPKPTHYYQELRAVFVPPEGNFANIAVTIGR
jgi:hypothetical protein